MDDLDRLVHDLNGEAHHALDRVSQVIRKTAFDIVETAQQLVPVDTGFLKGSIGDPTFESDQDSFSAEVGPTADYGAFVEYGTHRAGPQPYMGPAAERHEPLMERAIAQVVGKEIG